LPNFSQFGQAQKLDGFIGLFHSTQFIQIRSIKLCKRITAKWRFFGKINNWMFLGLGFFHCFVVTFLKYIKQKKIPDFMYLSSKDHIN
jgi:disulfide bond formation protein DsbB